MKTFLSKHTLHKILSLIKLDLSHKVDSRDQLTEDDVRLIWNEVTGKDIPNILSLQHNHDDLYSKLDHHHNSLYSTINHNHDNKYSSISHNHDTVYSKLNHNHDNLYVKTSSLKISDIQQLKMFHGDHNYIKNALNPDIPTIPYVSNYFQIYSGGTSGTNVIAIAIPTDYTDTIYYWNHLNKKWIANAPVK